MACPYCASQRLSRLMSPLKCSSSVVGMPIRSSTSNTTHAPMSQGRTVRDMSGGEGMTVDSEPQTVEPRRRDEEKRSRKKMWPAALVYVCAGRVTAEGG